MKQYKYKVKGVEYEVVINEIENNQAKVEVNGIPFEVELDRPMNVIHTPVVRPVHTHYSPVVATAPVVQEPESQSGNGAALRAPLPGTVNDVKVSVGQMVQKGQVLVVLEAMKMENNITAEQDGKVMSVCVNKGDSVREGAVLVTIG